MNKNLEDQLKEFKIKHFINADFNYLDKKINYLFKKFKKLKRSKEKDLSLLELYTTYIQIIEIFFINVYSLSEKDEVFPDALFVNSVNLRKFIEDNFSKTTELLIWFIKDILFQNKTSGSIFKQRYILYSYLIRECAEDYLEDFDLLNAFKHGYRIHAKYADSTFSLITKDNKGILLDKSDSYISYFLRERDDTHSKTIYKRTITFKNERLFNKAKFICALLKNMRVSVLLSCGQKIDEKIDLSDFNYDDWKNINGGSKIKEPIFSL